MLISIFALIIIFFIASLLTTKFKFKQESSIAITVLGIALFLYITGLFNIMKYGVYLIYLLTIFSIVYIIISLVKKKTKISELLTLNTVLYTIIIFSISIIVRNTFYIEWDEFSHWGANLKAMVQYDLFWSNNKFDGVHVVYTPIAGIIEYFFCRLNGGYSEDVAYLGINTFIISLLLPVLKDYKYSLKNTFKSLLFWIAVYCCMLLFKFKICSIYIDFLLGVLFTAGMFLAYRLDGKDDKINLMLIFITLPLLKDTGLLLLGIILMQLFFKYVLFPISENKKITKKEWKIFGILILILAVVLAFYMSWKVYCGINGRHLDDRHDKNAISQIDIKEFVKAVLLIPTINQKYSDISRGFYSALNGMAITANQYMIVSVLKLIILLDILGILLYIFTNDKKIRNKILILWINFNIGFILYSLLLLATFMFAFTEQEGRRLASMDRYMNTYFVAWFITAIACILSQKGRKNVTIVLIITLLTIYPMNFLSYINFMDRKGATAVSQEIATEAEIIKQNVNLGDKVYLVYQDIGGGLEYHILRYCISPIVTNLMYEWSLGPAYNADDIWSYDITKEQFVKKLLDEQFDYVFIAKIDKQFVDIYGDLINYDLKEENMNELNNKIFKIEKNGEDSIILNLVN